MYKIVNKIYAKGFISFIGDANVNLRGQFYTLKLSRYLFLYFKSLNFRYPQIYLTLIMATCG